MLLNIAQMKEFITGAVRFEETETTLTPLRFTKEQENVYENRNEESYMRTFASAGVKLMFKTTSKKLFLKVAVKIASSRKYFSFDVLVDGKVVGFLDNFSSSVLPKKYTNEEFPLGDFEKEFDLGDGEKEVCVHFPWSMQSTIKEVGIDDGAQIKSCKPSKKLLVYGDSITQGYDSLRTSNRYIARIAHDLGAEEINKAIGGEKFLPDLTKHSDDFVPDYIWVSYGTNDWCTRTEKAFRENCNGFFKNLRKNYKEVKIFVTTPIWAQIINEEKSAGPFLNIDKYIREEVSEFDNITVISGINFVPHDEKYFADLVHPNDAGFNIYYNNLKKTFEL